MPNGVKARRHGARWQGLFRRSTYWFSAKRHGRAVTYGSAAAARTAAALAAPVRSKATPDATDTPIADGHQA